MKFKIVTRQKAQAMGSKWAVWDFTRGNSGVEPGLRLCLAVQSWLHYLIVLQVRFLNFFMEVIAIFPSQRCQETGT